LHRRITLSLLLVVSLWGILPQVIRGDGAAPLSPETLSSEAQTVYLTNLARRERGLPPLRWNAQLSNAARWFSWDSVAQRPNPYCGHEDTLGRWPGDRARLFGYLGTAGAENAFCGDVTPQQAIDGWMQSEGHRENLLAPNWREVGLGYYRQPDGWRGYVTQDFGHDAVHPPVIIAYEALTTTTPLVDLYIYSNEHGGFTGMGPATEMMISNEPCLIGADWEAYTQRKTWRLSPGEGWRTVYVQTRDALGRTVTVSDTIYLGSNLPLAELGDAQMSSTRAQVTLYPTEPNDLPMVQFSLGWLGDDSFGTFKHWWGAGERVDDAEARGGSAYRLRSGEGESFASVYTCDFVRDVPLVAYFRLKVANNTEPGEVARLTVSGSGVEYGPLSLRGTDFAAPNVYQEFALPFMFPSGEDPFLIFKWWRSGETDVTIDSVSIFTAPQPASVPLVWDVPGGNYRGQGIWLRYTDGQEQFSAIQQASLYPPGWQVSPDSLSLVAERDAAPLPSTRLQVRPPCGACGWQVTGSAPWLAVEALEGEVQVRADPAGLALGVHTSTLTLLATGVADAPRQTVPVTLRVVGNHYRAHVPVIWR